MLAASAKIIFRPLFFLRCFMLPLRLRYCSLRCHDMICCHMLTHYTLYVFRFFFAMPLFFFSPLIRDTSHAAMPAFHYAMMIDTASYEHCLLLPRMSPHYCHINCRYTMNIGHINSEIATAQLSSVSRIHTLDTRFSAFAAATPRHTIFTCAAMLMLMRLMFADATARRDGYYDTRFAIV